MSEQINKINFKKSNNGTTQNSVIKQAKFISDYDCDYDLNGIFLIAPDINNGNGCFVYKKKFTFTIKNYIESILQSTESNDIYYNENFDYYIPVDKSMGVPSTDTSIDSWSLVNTYYDDPHVYYPTRAEYQRAVRTLITTPHTTITISYVRDGNSEPTISTFYNESVTLSRSVDTNILIEINEFTETQYEEEFETAFTYGYGCENNPPQG